MPAAIGLVEVEGVAGIILAADAAIKAADVKLLGWESIGGFTTVFFEGSTSDVNAGLSSACRAAESLEVLVNSSTITQPDLACFSFVTFDLSDNNSKINQAALGIVETQGYASQILTNDEMVKTAGVSVVNVLTVHDRVVCSLVQGDIGAVKEAVARAKDCLYNYPHLKRVAILPQPREEVLFAFAQSERGGGGA
jgi:microcompartment protein CcmL/EutN